MYSPPVTIALVHYKQNPSRHLYLPSSSSMMTSTVDTRSWPHNLRAHARGNLVSVKTKFSESDVQIFSLQIYIYCQFRPWEGVFSWLYLKIDYFSSLFCRYRPDIWNPKNLREWAILPGCSSRRGSQLSSATLQHCNSPWRSWIETHMQSSN